MIKYSLKLNRKYIFTNIFNALQLATVFVLLIVTTSSIMSRIDDYVPLYKILSSPGKCIYVSEVNYVNNQRFTFTIDEILSAESNISEIFAGYKVDFVPTGTENYNCAYSYAQNMANLYTPQMQVGKWISEANIESDVLEVVVSDSDNYKVGDIISFYDANNDKNEYIAKVIGVISKDSKVLGLDSSSDNVIDFRNMYKSINDNCYFFSFDQLKKHGIEAQVFGQMFVTYEKNLNVTELLSLNRNLYKYGANFGLNDELNINSINYIRQDIMLIFPITMCILILIIISEVAVAAIQTKQKLRSYVIFCICGSTVKKCAIINLVRSMIVSLLGIIFAGTFILFNHKTLSKSYILDFGLIQFLVCFVVIIINMLLAVIIPKCIMSFKSIKEELTCDK